jgi:hypothetical protein
MHPSRLLPLAALAGLLAASPARAQTTPTPTPTPQPGTVQLTKADFLLRVQKKVDDKWVLLPDIEARRYFNKARCECDETVAIRVELSQAGTQKRPLIKEGTVELWAGPAACVASDIANRPRDMMGCTKIADLPPLNIIAKSLQNVEVTVGQLFRAGNVPANRGCNLVFSQSLWLWVDVDKNGSPDMSIGGDQAPTLPIALDGEPPAPPGGVEVTPGNEALNVSWTRDNVSADQNGYVVFCSRAGLPVFKDTYYTGTEYQSRQSLCGSGVTPIAQRLVLNQASGEPPPALAVNAPAEFQNLDKAFVCSELLTTSTGWRIRILQNGIPYQVGVAAVDVHGNASPLEVAYVQTPIPTRDFFDAYREAGGEAEGGFCAYGQRPRPAGWVVALLGATALGLALVRARRRR